MASNALILRVMVASPGDVTEDRRAVVDAIHEWNRVHSQNRGISLLPWLWETDSVPMMGEHPQTVIDRQGVDDSDIVIALFWSRLRSPTPQAVSGTASEISRATSAGKFVHVYFSERGHPANVDTQQLDALRNFKHEIQQLGLLGEYDSSTLAVEINRAIALDLRLLAAREADSRDLVAVFEAALTDATSDTPSPTLVAETSPPPTASVVSDAAAEPPAESDPIAELSQLIEDRGSDARAVHMRIRKEASRLEALPVLDSSPASYRSMSYEQRLPILERELRTWAGYTALLASWPGSNTDRWWAELIDRYGSAPRLDGYVDAIDSFAAPAVVTLYAGGVAAAAQYRFDAVCDLLTAHPLAKRNLNGRAPASAVLTAGTLYPHDPWPSRRLAGYLGPILADDVALGTTPTIDAWERFEYVWLLASWNRHKREQPSAWFDPYVRVDDDYATRTTRRDTRPLPSVWLEGSPEPFRTVQDGLFEGDADRLREAMSDIDETIHEFVDRAETQDLMRRGGVAWMPSGVRRATVKTDDPTDPWPPVGSSAGN